MRKSVFAAFVAVHAVALASAAHADSSAASALQGFAKTVGASCNGDQCMQLDVTMIELFSGHRARYCQGVFAPHDWNNEGSQINVSEIDTSSPQYRSNQTWNYSNAISFVQSLGYGVTNPVPPRINLPQDYPFAPFQTDTCNVKLNVSNGGLTVGSVQPGSKGEADISYDLSFKNDTFSSVASGGGGVVVIVTPGPYTVYRPPR